MFHKGFSKKKKMVLGIKGSGLPPKRKEWLPKTSLLCQKDRTLPCSFSLRQREKCDVRASGLAAHPHGLSVACSRFRQDCVCDLKHVAGYVFPIYQLFH